MKSQRLTTTIIKASMVRLITHLPNRNNLNQLITNNLKIKKMKTLVENPTKTKWMLDLAHSELGFKVKHLMISNVKGEFRKFTAEIEGEDFVSSQAKVTIDASSVFTNDEGRDGHLKGAEFFDVENHKEISFVSTSFQHVNESSYKLTGILTMK